MKKDQLIKYAMIAAGAYAAYWYVTNYGPSGAVNDANGNAIPGAVSWWASWFGGVSATTALPSGPSATGISATSPTTSTSAPSTTPSNGTVSTQQMATAAQISAIQALIVPADLAAFQAMIPNLTYAQAQTMLSNAEMCGQGTGYNPTNGICQSTVAQTNQSQIRTSAPGRQAGTIAPGGTGGTTRTQNTTNPSMDGLGQLGQIMPLSPNITPADNGVRNPSSLGMILPSPGTPASTGGQGMGALPKKSPWGRLPVNNYVN